MLWDKKKYKIKLKGGRGVASTDPMQGLIEHLIVIPNKIDMIWSMQIKDMAGDVIYEVIDNEGRLDDKDGLPVGFPHQEKLNIIIYDTTINDEVNVIFKVGETR